MVYLCSLFNSSFLLKLLMKKIMIENYYMLLVLFFLLKKNEQVETKIMAYKKLVSNFLMII
jgi:hypothetical protein